MSTRSLEYDIHFFFNKPRVELLPYSHLRGSEFSHIKSYIENFAKKFKEFYIFTPHEKILSNIILNNIIKLITNFNNNGYEIYLCMATTTQHPLFLNPLCSVLHYTGEYSKDKNHVGNHSNKEKIKLLDLNYYQNQIKNERGVLSIRKTTEIRDLFYSKFDKNFNGIFRYSRMDRGNNTGNYKPQTFSNLIKEYNSSYFSFIFETDTNDSLNSFTEKTMIGFLSKTLPILFITKENQLQEFKNLGFNFINYYFGYDTINENDSNETKVIKFIECITRFNNLSDAEIVKIYNDNIKLVDTNFQLVKNILEKEIPYKKDKLIVEKQIF